MTVDKKRAWTSWAPAAVTNAVAGRPISLAMRARMNGILAAHTHRDIEQIRKDTDRNFFMSAEEALEYGIVDEVIKKSAAAS